MFFSRYLSRRYLRVVSQIRTPRDFTHRCPRAAVPPETRHKRLRGYAATVVFVLRIGVLTSLRFVLPSLLAFSVHSLSHSLSLFLLVLSHSLSLSLSLFLTFHSRRSSVLVRVTALLLPFSRCTLALLIFYFRFLKSGIHNILG